MNYVIFVLGTVIAGVGIYVGQKLCRKSTKIEFKISVLNIILLAFSMFALISVVMAVEMFTNHLILLNWNPQYWGLKIVKELINFWNNCCCIVAVIVIAIWKMDTRF